MPRAKRSHMAHGHGRAGQIQIIRNQRNEYLAREYRDHEFFFVFFSFISIKSQNGRGREEERKIVQSTFLMLAFCMRNPLMVIAASPHSLTRCAHCV